MEEARESLAADVVAAAREASAEGAPKYSQWTQQAKQVLGDAEGEGGAVAADDGAAAGDGSALETMDALAKVSDRYALDADAVSHLEDCNGLITGLSSYPVSYTHLDVYKRQPTDSPPALGSRMPTLKLRPSSRPTRPMTAPATAPTARAASRRCPRRPHRTSIRATSRPTPTRSGAGRGFCWAWPWDLALIHI